MRTTNWISYAPYLRKLAARKTCSTYPRRDLPSWWKLKTISYRTSRSRTKCGKYSFNNRPLHSAQPFPARREFPKTRNSHPETNGKMRITKLRSSTSPCTNTSSTCTHKFKMVPVLKNAVVNLAEQLYKNQGQLSPLPPREHKSELRY